MSGAATTPGSAWLRACLALVTVIALLAVGLDRVTADPEPVTVPPPAGGPLATGLAVCALGDTAQGRDLRLEVAAAGAPDDPPTVVEAEIQRAGERTSLPVPRVFPGAGLELPVEATGEPIATVRWRDQPAAIARSWRTGGRDLPVGLVSGPCAEVVTQTAVVPGLSTLGGAEARLRIANPFPADAAIAVRFVGPAGSEEPLALQNVSVAARSHRDIVVNDFLPQRDDLAAVVEVRAGRVAVEGLQVARAAIGGIDAVSLLAAASAAAETWTLPWLSTRPDEASWLWVVNLGERPSLVELTFATPDGGVVPDGLSELTVPPGELRRVDLRGTFPPGLDTAGLVVRADGAPVYVSAAVERRVEDDPAAGALAVQLAAPGADADWVLTGSTPPDRDERLRLVNPGSEPAELRLTGFADRAPRAPANLAALTVGPGAALELPLAEVIGDARSWAVFVTAEQGEVVVGRVGHRPLPPPPADPDDPEADPDDPDAEPDEADEPEDADGPDDAPDDADEDAEVEGDADGDDDPLTEVFGLVLSLGTPSSLWRTEEPGARASAESGLVRQLGTRMPAGPR